MVRSRALPGRRTAVFAGAVTLVAGAALVAAPRRMAGPLGLAGREAALRAIGTSDLVLAPGLLGATPRWPWMLGRAGLNVLVASYLHRVAPDATSPVPRPLAGTLAVLAWVDGAAALRLHRAEA